MKIVKDDRTLQIILHMTHKCNLKCKYCYYDSEMLKNPGGIDLQLVSVLFKRLAESDFQSFNLHLHGGEPFLKSYNFYEELFSLQRDILKDKMVNNMVQTNGTLIDDDYIEFLKRLRASGSDLVTAISLDGPEKMNDINRVLRDGKGSYQMVIKGIEALIKGGEKFGISTTFTESTLKDVKGLYNIYKSYQDHLISTNTLIFHEPNSASGSGKLFSDGYIELFELWFYDEECRFNMNLLMSYIFSLLGKGRTYHCGLLHNCINDMNMISIDINGDITFCDNFPHRDMGNIGRDSINEIMMNRQRVEEGRKAYNRNDCLFCPWYRYCGGGCLADVKDGKYRYCSDVKLLLAHIKRALEEVGIDIDEPQSYQNYVNIKNPALKGQLAGYFSNTLSLV